MELPRNVVQIGKPDKLHKIFVEDYVISYIKQLNRVCEGKSVGLAFYGRHYEEDGLQYYFLYGAAKIDGLEHRDAYLSQVEKEEIAEIGRRHFEQYDFLAWSSVRDEPLEGFYVQRQGKGVEVKGYACFYEKNESMLNYMLLLDRKEKTEQEASGEKAGRGEWSASSYQKTVEPPVDEHPKASVTPRASAPTPSVHKPQFGRLTLTAALLVVCVIAITTLNDYEKLEDLQVAAGHVIASLTEQKLPDEPTVPVDTTEPVMESSVPETVEMQETQTAQQEPLVSGPDMTIPQVTESEPPAEPEVPAETEEEVSAPLPVSYTVMKGDTLISICTREYGSLERMQEICELNGISNPDSIEVGQILLLP